MNVPIVSCSLMLKDAQWDFASLYIGKLCPGLCSSRTGATSRNVIMASAACRVAAGGHMRMSTIGVKVDVWTSSMLESLASMACVDCTQI